MLCARRIFATSGSVLALVAANPALANTNAAAPQLEEVRTDLEPRAEKGRQVYDAAQFVRFAPQTALDMVGQIPGFQISQVSSDRGLGEASQNVLINGQRITGKSNGRPLSRIAASSVIQLNPNGATLNVSGLNGRC
jgi:hypothetical protein